MTAKFSLRIFVALASLAPAIASQTHAASNPVSVSFKPGWDASRWMFIKEKREKQLGSWKQGPTYVENDVPAGVGPDGMMPGKGAAGACWSVLKDMSFRNGTIEATFPWEKLSGCPAIIYRTSIDGVDLAGIYYMTYG